MSYSINSSNPIEFLNPNRIWKIGHKGHLRELDVSGIVNISGNMHFTNRITGYHLDLSGDVSFNQNLHVSGNTRFQRAPYQEIDSDLSYNYYGGTFGLAKHSLPKQNDKTSKNLISNTNYDYIFLHAANTTDIVNSDELQRLMVIGSNGYYASSSNGVYWDFSGNTSSNQLNQIIWAYEQSKFVIVGDNGYVAISSDSSNIDISSTIISVNTLNSIAWSPQLGIYLVVGRSNTTSAFTATSTDAITWSNNTTFDDVEELTSVIWVPELKRFIGVGSYTPNGGIDYYGFYISTQDGINWDISGHIASINDCPFNSVAWSPELARITAVGDGGFYATARAENDSLIWDYSGNIPTIELYYKIIWIPHLQRFVAVGKNGIIGNIISSLDGIIWDLSADVPRVSRSIAWAENLGKLYIPDTNGRIYNTNPKYVFQTTYNLFQDAILQELEVNGDASFNKNVDIEQHLTVRGDVSFNKNLDISGKLFARTFEAIDVSFRNLDISDQLLVHGDVSFMNTLIVHGDASYQSSLTIQYRLNTGNTDISGSLDVSGRTTLDGTDNISLLVMHDACFNQNIIIGGDGTSGFIYGPPDLFLDPVLPGFPDNSGRVIIRGDLVTLGTRTIVNSSVVEISDNIITMNANQAIIRYGGFEVRDKNQHLRPIRFDNDLDRWDISDDLFFHNNVEFNEDVSFNGKVDISEQLRVFNDASFNRDVDIEQNLIVHGDVSFNKNLDISGRLTTNTSTVTGDVSFNKSLDVSDQLLVYGDVSFMKTLIVHGDASYQSSVTISNTLSVNNNVEISNNLYVNGDVSFQRNLDVSHTLTSAKLIILDDVSFHGKVDISENLYVNNDVSFQRNLDISYTLTSTKLIILGDSSFNNSVDICNQLIVHGDISFNANIDICDRLIVHGDISFNKNLDVSNHLRVHNDVSLNKNVDISNQLYVYGDVSFQKNLDVSYSLTSKKLIVFEDTSLNGYVDISNNLYVNGDVSFQRNLDVSHTLTSTKLIVLVDSSFNNSVDISNQLIVHGDVCLNSNIDICDHLIVRGDVSLNNTLDVSGITTLSDHLLTDSSYVKVPVSYSTFAVVKGNDLSSNITQVFGTWHNLTNDGYSVTINPLTQYSYIKLEFKVNYICSNETDQTISFRIKNNHDEIIFSDLSIGTLMGVTNRGVYNGVYIDSSGYNSPVTYHLEYLIADDATNNIDVSSGVLGYNHGNSNIVIAQELYVPIEKI
tara:strand:- start:15777 stop:19436 length:3660 start_codon:yes stop_codon:yes gene_type:complete